MQSFGRTLATFVLAVFGTLAFPALSPAQSSGDGFLFGAPRASVSVHLGYADAGAGSELFTFVTDQLTLDRSDFSGLTAAANAGVRLTDRVDLTLAAAYAGSRRSSEFRDWVDLDDRSIEQRTRFERVPVTVGAKLYLLPRGRSVGRLAWIPAAYAPYVGVGAGMVWYRFKQDGDFVDFDTLDVFSDELESTGWAPAAQLVGGLDITLHPRVALTGEARYLKANAELDGDFEGFDPIDLSDLSATVGISVRL
jgi:hypothetical protein